MANYLSEFQAQVERWPTPIEVAHAQGDVFVTLLQHEGYIEAKWAGHITADDVITGAKVHLAILQLHPCSKLLNNKQDVTGDWSEANDWLQFGWMPDAKAAGLSCVAHVYSGNMFSRLSARDLMQRISSHIVMNNFNDFDTAKEWLIDCILPHEAAAVSA
ncbi:hypothetical protein ACFSKU_00235 [Pontibacter silvestris]|uniref:STAS/SEC14 domain-containing protein n=1 Tax=Pontibacter silvestris TaxID=2305183 RepID=A0ABW4WU61_9BACT|nr:hypothetical protein [Pontibacter silvestris]MCC9138559.1 hypothetical protein [Pontibacter silvestris]